MGKKKGRGPAPEKRLALTELPLPAYRRYDGILPPGAQRRRHIGWWCLLAAARRDSEE